MHIWKKETAKEKKEAQKVIDALNVKLEPSAKAEWEITTSMRRLN